MTSRMAISSGYSGSMGVPPGTFKVRIPSSIVTSTSEGYIILIIDYAHSQGFAHLRVQRYDKCPGKFSEFPLLHGVAIAGQDWTTSPSYCQLSETTVRTSVHGNLEVTLF